MTQRQAPMQPALGSSGMHCSGWARPSKDRKSIQYLWTSALCSFDLARRPCLFVLRQGAMMLLSLIHSTSGKPGLAMHVVDAQGLLQRHHPCNASRRAHGFCMVLQKAWEKLGGSADVRNASGCQWCKSTMVKACVEQNIWIHIG